MLGGLVRVETVITSDLGDDDTSAISRAAL